MKDGQSGDMLASSRCNQVEHDVAYAALCTYCDVSVACTVLSVCSGEGHYGGGEGEHWSAAQYRWHGGSGQV